MTWLQTLAARALEVATPDRVLAVAAIAAGFLVYWWQRSRPALDYTIIYDEPLLRGVYFAPAPRLQLHFDEQPVHEARLTLVGFWNTGTSSIEPQHFHGPIRITCPDGGRLLDAAPVAEDDRSLPCSLTVDETSATVTPMLLNPGDKFAIRIVRDGGGNAPVTIGARISGVKSLRALPLPPVVPSRVFGMVAVLSMVAIIVAAFSVPGGRVLVIDGVEYVQIKRWIYQTSELMEAGALFGLLGFFLYRLRSRRR